jgi:transcriptional regulator with XRE-family HTH domain
MAQRERSARLTGRFSSVEEMVRATSDDQSFVDEFVQKMARQRIVNLLVSLRGVKGFTQKDLAERMNCTQSRISKIENSLDEEIGFGDFRQYASALGLTIQLVLMPRKARSVDRVKYHAMQIKKLVDALAGLAGDDSAIAQGVSAFFGEAAYNLIAILQEAADKLPKEALPTDDEGTEVEICGPEEPKVLPAPPKRVRKAKGARTKAGAAESPRS